MSLRDLRRLRGDRRGATAVEFALICPVLFAALLGLIEVGRLGWTQSSLQFAVEEAARCASIRADICGTAAQTASYAASRAPAPQIRAAAFTRTTEACGVQVRARLSYAFVAKGLLPSGPVLTARSCRP